jgi:hypothetical protein
LIRFLIIVLSTFLFVTPIYGDNGGGDGQGDGEGEGEGQGNQSTRTFTLNQSNELDVSSLDSNFEYVTYLLQTLQMQTSAFLSNAYNGQSAQSTEEQRYSGRITYTPSSKWNYNIEYIGDTNHSLRPQSSDYDYYEAKGTSQSLNSALVYNFTDTLNNTLSFDANHSRSFSQIPNRSPIRSEVSGRNIGTTMSYALTGTTNFNTGCTIGRTHTIYPPHNPEDPIPSNPSSPDLAGLMVNLDQFGINAGFSDNRKILEHIDMGTSFSHNESVGKDSQNPVNDNLSKNTNAQSSLTWAPMDKLRFPLTLNFSDSEYIYRNLAIHRQIKERQIKPGTSTSENILLDFYNTHNLSYGGDIRFEWEPAGYARFNVTGHQASYSTDYFDENGNPPPLEDPRVYQISNSTDRSETANLSMVIGQNVNFSLTQILNETLLIYPSYHQNDNNRLADTMNGSITYDFSPRLSTSITTGMSDTFTDNYNPNTQDTRILGVNFNTSFTLKMLDGTRTTFGYTVSKDGSGEIDPRYPQWTYNPQYQENLVNTFSAGVSHDYTVLSPSITSSFSQTLSNRPTAPINNYTTYNWSVLPSLTIRPSEIFYTNIYSSLSGYIRKYPENPSQQEERQSIGYHSVSFNYSPTPTISFDIGVVYRTQWTRPHQILPQAERPEYFNTSSSVSVQF